MRKVYCQPKTSKYCRYARPVTSAARIVSEKCEISRKCPTRARPTAMTDKHCRIAPSSDANIENYVTMVELPKMRGCAINGMRAQHAEQRENTSDKLSQQLTWSHKSTRG